MYRTSNNNNALEESCIHFNGIFSLKHMDMKYRSHEAEKISKPKKNISKIMIVVMKKKILKMKKKKIIIKKITSFINKKISIMKKLFFRIIYNIEKTIMAGRWKNLKSYKNKTNPMEIVVMTNEKNIHFPNPNRSRITILSARYRQKSMFSYLSILKISKICIQKQ